MKTFPLAALAAFTAFSAPALADENPFTYNYTADVEEAGKTEAEFWITGRRGKGEGHYDAQDYRFELEHGFTERFGASAYIDFASHHVSGLDPDLDAVQRDFAFQGLSAEFKYKLLDDERDGIGFTIYAEPGWSRIHDVEGKKSAEYELEIKAIFSKGFYKDKVIWAGNLTFEPEWEHERGAATVSSRWEKELKLQGSMGVSFRVLPQLYIGGEARYSAVYPNWNRGLHGDSSALFAGPTVSFSADDWSGQLSFLPQLGGSPSPAGGRNLDEFEKREFRLRISHEL